MYRKINGVGEGDFAASERSAEVANDFSDGGAWIGRADVGVGDDAELGTFKAKKVVSRNVAFKGEGQARQGGRNAPGDLLNVVDVENFGSARSEGLRHYDQVRAAGAGRNSEIKKKRFPRAADGRNGVNFTRVRRFKLDFYHGTDGFSGKYFER